MDNDFQVISDPNEAYESVGGTSLQSYIAIKPVHLVWTFGKPLEADGYKVSGEYVFKHRSGQMITLYDWKNTNLYDPEISLMPNDFWTSNKNYEFHIGAHGMGIVDDFQEWCPLEIRKHFG